MIQISTVTPVYSGAPFLEALVAELANLRRLLNRLDGEIELAECIFVLDGPRDDSGAVLAALEERHEWIRVIALSRNFGQHNATVAGILHCSGDWVVTLDEDLQHPPRSIPDLLVHAAEHGADVVHVKPERGSHGRGYRDFSSKLAKRIIGWASGNRHAHQFGSFRLIRGPIARAVASVCSHQTYFDVAMLWFTDRIRAVHMDLTDTRYVRERTSGYSFRSLLSHAKRFLFSSDVQFFKLTILVSGISFITAIVLQSWVLLSYFFRPDVPLTEGWASLMSVNLFYGGVISLLLGFTLEFVRTSLFHGQGKPTFFVVDRSSDRELLSLALKVRDALHADQSSMTSNSS